MIRWAGAFGVAAMVTLSLAACGGSSSEGSSDASGSKASGEAAAFMEKAKQAASGAVTAIDPAVPAEGPKAQPGKTIVTIPCAAAAQGCKAAVDWFKKAAADVGWKTLEIDPAGDPSKMADAVYKAINTKADGIFTAAIDAATIKAPLKQARAAGLKMACFACVNTDQLLDTTVPAEDEYIRDGYNLAAQAFVDTGGHPKMIVLSDNEFGIVNRRIEGVEKFVAECKAAGADCQVLAEQNILVTKISTTVPPQVVSMARQHPDWNALIAPHDAALTFIVPALEQAGVASKGKAYGFDPIDVNMGWIRDGRVQTSTVASPYRWVAYAAIDQLNRRFAGQPVVDQGVKDKLVIKDNAPPEGETYLDDGDPSAAFGKLWSAG